jgi:hypothetical protein
VNLWRRVASVLLALGGALVGFLLASRRGAPDSQRESEQTARDQKRIAELNASMLANQHAVTIEQQKQRDLAQDATGIDRALGQVDARVEGLTHDNLDAEIHRALAGAPDPGAAPVIVRPGGVIKPAS